LGLYMKAPDAYVAYQSYDEIWGSTSFAVCVENESCMVLDLGKGCSNKCVTAALSFANYTASNFS